MMSSAKRRNGESSGSRSLSTKVAIAVSAFLFGCLVSTMMVLNFMTVINSPSGFVDENVLPSLDLIHGNKPSLRNPAGEGNAKRVVDFVEPLPVVQESANSIPASATVNHLVGKKILIAIAAFDFSQIPHLGEVLDAYQDLCVTGASKIDIVIHATVPYPVTLIDLLNSRLLPGCKGIFSISIVLKPKSLRLHLVDCHRELFYREIDNYDLFIYTEDDIRVPPRVVGAYLEQTHKLQEIVGLEASSNFNVGIVRYEYNFPSNVIMDDKTRHATQNVSRVYWEHGFYPVVGEAVKFVMEENLQDTYVRMQNEHQGMFFATSFLLKKWKERKNCKFDEVRNRPARKDNPHQPSEGTQRVW